MSVFDRYPDEVARFDTLMEAPDSRNERKDAIEKAIRIAERLVDECSGDADAYQLLGVAWYEYPVSSSWRSWRCRRALERALELDPEHDHARRFLACINFDQERYEEALTLLDDCRDEFWVQLNLECVALKNEEMKLVCRLRLFPNDFPDKEFELFTRRFLDAQAREGQNHAQAIWYWPQELREHAEWMLMQGTAPCDPRVVKIREFLSQAGYADSLWDSVFH